MGLFASAEEQEQQAQRYFARVFPRGERQQQEAQALLDQLVPELAREERTFTLVRLRDILTSGADEARMQEDLKIWYGDHLAQAIAPERRAALYALARHMGDGGALPDADALLREGEALLAGELADWPKKNRRSTILRTLLGRSR